MELTPYEKKAIKEFISATNSDRLPKDVLGDCRGCVISLVQNICIEKYKLSLTSHEFKEPIKYIVHKDFFSYKDSRNQTVYHSQQLEKIHSQIQLVTQNRNLGLYSAEDLDDYESSIQCKSALNVILKWYINDYKRLILSDIKNLNSTEKHILGPLFKTITNKTERIIERENYYVVLLMDSSQSMLWPYLKDPSNWDKDNSEDYKNAVSEVQKAMQFAHEKSLKALRGSSICNHGYLKVYQYTFNHRKKLLNEPEDLSHFGFDKVIAVNSYNYIPEGKTALYDVIDESLKVVYDKYLRRAMEDEKRIDKVVIGVITDGEDTVLDPLQKVAKVDEIKKYLGMLRGNGDISKCFLVSSVLIGLTSLDFSETKLKEIRRELNFDESISISQTDEQSIRKAFKLFSTNAINV